METTTFAELGLSAKVLAAIEAAGYTSPTPIQAQAIPVAVTGRDVLGIAQTGTGKTASYVLPMIHRLEMGRARARMPRSLILAPTRELAAQVAQNFEKYGTNHRLTVALLIGGVSFEEQNAKLDRGVDVLIATPGRLLDHFQRGRVMLVGVDILVVDEADRMLDMGFIPDIEKLCKLLPPKRQTLFFSATMPPEITRLVDQFMKEPTRIEVAPPATTAMTITQRFKFCDNPEDWSKREVLRQLISEQDVKNAIIFCNRKRDVAILYKSMKKHGFNAGELHGDMDQTSRTATLDGFRGGSIQYLIASDVAARGLDIPEVSHVYNFDMPWDADDYVHRIGRTGRAGREGYAASLVTAEDLKVLGHIEKRAGTDVTWIGEAPGPDAAENARGRRGRGRGRAAGGREERGGSRGRSEGDRGGDRGRDRGGDRAERNRPVAEAEGEVRAVAMPVEGEIREGRSRSRGGRGRGPRPQQDQHADGAPLEARQPRQRELPSEPMEQPEFGQPFEPPRAARRPSPAQQGEDRRPRERQPRDQSRERPGQDQPRERVSQDQPRERANQDQPHERHGQDQPRGRRSEQPQSEPVRERQPQRTEAAPRPRSDGNRPALTAHPRGLGDNIPAFLRRPVRIGERSQ